MTDKIRDMDRTSPEDLMKGFGGRGMAGYLVLAVVLHVVIIGGSSGLYLYESFLSHFDRPAYDAYVKAKEEKAKAKAKVPTAAPAPAAEAPADPGQAAVTSGGAKPADPNMEGIPEDKRDNPVVKKITEAAKPSEIPAAPDELGISIDDTNPK